MLDRPSVTGVLQDPAAVEELAAAARSRGTVVVLDEAYANYAGPSASCAPAVARHDNLVVLRSLSKGYCCGGMRIGFALAAPELTRRIREFAPPLAANSAGLGVALSLLGQGDVFAGLRRRIAEVKPEVSTLLRRAGLRPSDGAPFLPWLTVPADEQARALIEKRSLRVKAVDDELFKISVPLSQERLAAFRAAFADHAQVENGARG
ncbi:aminotransferase class I/II-fold pyridoxal phosphate-dependent enzyme [Streptacidiphilus monticola]